MQLVNEAIEIELTYAMTLRQFEDHLPEYFSWDNLFDVLLFQTVAAQFVYNLNGFDGNVTGLDVDESRN